MRAYCRADGPGVIGSSLGLGVVEGQTVFSAAVSAVQVPVICRNLSRKWKTPVETSAVDDLIVYRNRRFRVAVPWKEVVRCCRVLMVA